MLSTAIINIGFRCIDECRDVANYKRSDCEARCSLELRKSNDFKLGSTQTDKITVVKRLTTILL